MESAPKAGDSSYREAVAVARALKQEEASECETEQSAVGCDMWIWSSMKGEM